jgi:hypothetical protein
MADDKPAPQYDEKTLENQFLEGRARASQGDPVALLNGLIGAPPNRPASSATPRSAPVSTPASGAEAGGRDNPPGASSSLPSGPAGPPASPTATSLGQRVLDAFHTAEKYNIGPFNVLTPSGRNFVLGADKAVGQDLGDIAKSIWEAGPQTIHDVLTGKIDPYSEEGQAKARETALLMTGEGMTGAPELAAAKPLEAAREVKGTGEIVRTIEGEEPKAAEGAEAPKPVEGAPAPPSPEEMPKPGAVPPVPAAEAPKPGAAPATVAPPKAAAMPPPFTIRGKEPTAEGAPTPTPEDRDAAVRYLNNQSADNPMQNSLRAMSNNATQQQTIEDAAKFVPRDKVQPDDIRDMNAYALQTDPATLAHTVTENLKGMPERMAAFNMLINSSAEEAANFAKIAAASKLPEDYTRALDAATHLMQLTRQWTETGTAMARAFRTRQQPFDTRTDWGAAVHNIIDQVGASDAQKLVDQLALIEDPKKVAPFISALRWMKSSDGLLYGWYNSILSNYHVVGKKLLSDTAMLTWQLATHYTAEKLGSGAVASGETLDMLQAYFASMGDAIKTAGRAMRQGQSQFDPTHQTLDGQTFSRSWLYAQGQKPMRETPPNELAIEVLRGMLPTSVMGGIDDFYKTINYRGQLAALVRREATNQIAQEARLGVGGNSGLTPAEIGIAEITGQTPTEILKARPPGPDLPVAITHADQIQHRIQELLNNVPPHLHEQALAIADRNLFTEELSGNTAKFADLFGGLVLRTRGGFEIPVGRLILPFMTRPFNIIREAARSSPIAPLLPSYREAMRQGGAAADLAKAKFGLGSFVAALAGTLAATYIMTGRGPPTPAARKAWADAGHQPYTFYGFHYRNFEPLATLLAPIADTVDAFRFAKDDATVDQLADSLMFGLGHSLLEASPLQGLQQFLDSLSSEGPRNEGFFQRFAMSFEPSLLRAWKANQDPWLRAHQTLLQNFWASTPFLSTHMPLQYDMWGDPIPDNHGFNVFWTGAPGEVPKGYDLDAGRTTPLEKWIWDNRRAFPNNENDGGRIMPREVPSIVSKSEGGLTARYQLNNEQQARYQHLAGQGTKDPTYHLGFKEAANDLMAGTYPNAGIQRQWDKGAPEDKARQLLLLQRSYREAALAQLGSKSEYPEIGEALRAQIESQKATIKQHRAEVGADQSDDALAGAAARGHVVAAPSMGVTR